jgi:hypothetical protein
MVLGHTAAAQCSPVDCLDQLPPSGGLCPTPFAVGQVDVAYSDAVSFHVTDACVEATLFDPELTGVSVRITQLGSFTFTELPAGLTGVSDQVNYAPQSNGCALLSGTPTEAGVFAATVNILANVNAWPFSLTCGGFGPIAQNNNPISYQRELVILPNAGFSGLPTELCTSDPIVLLTPTGTPGGTFSGPGVVGPTFNPATAGVGIHTITYTVSAQQGAAIAPATNSSSITVEVNEDCLGQCLADAGTLTGGGTLCLTNGFANLAATADGNSNVPPGYSTLYLLTQGAELLIISANGTPDFVVNAAGIYTIHFMVYDQTLDLSNTEFGVTLAGELVAQMIQGGGTVCASLDVVGAAFNVVDCTEPCPDGFVRDCDGNCSSSALIGDGNCDAQFNCATFGFDGGDCIVVCDANAGTLTADASPVCLLNDEATLSATADGNAVVPVDYLTAYVLTQGPELLIIAAGGTPEFTVNAAGDYTIHTLVYDPLTLDLGIVEFGVTTGFDVNALLIQGGGTICASLDVVGAPIVVEDCTEPCEANAGTLTEDASPVCLLNDEATLSATADGNATVPVDYLTAYVLTQGPELLIIAAGGTPEFIVNAAGDYTIHTLVYDPLTLDLGIVEFGVTTGFDVNGLLIQGGGTICASLDVVGAPIVVEDCTEPCTADAGTITADLDVVCFIADETVVSATPDDNSVVPDGYSTVYVLTAGPELLIVDVATTPNLLIPAVGAYTIHTLVYDPLTLDLGIVELGVTTGFDVNALLIQGGGTICASLDVAGAPVTAEVCAACLADAGNLTADADTVCLVAGSAIISATADGSAVVPDGYTTVYVLTQGPGLVIVGVNLSTDFGVTAAGDYTIHTLVYDPLTLDLSIVEPGVTTGFDVNALLIQGGGTICASLDVTGAPVNVELCDECLADAGTLTADEAEVCLQSGVLLAIPDGNSEVPQGFQTIYVLTQGPGLVILAVDATPTFTVTEEGSYTIHTLVYDPLTLDLGIVEPGVTTGFDVNALLIQGGGEICASLDVAGAAYTVSICGALPELAANSFAVFPNPTQGTLNIRTAVEGLVQLELMDLSGRVVYSAQRNTAGNETFTVQLGNDLAPGSYVLRFITELGSSEQRIILQR